MYIDRKTIIAENLIREHVRKRLQYKYKESFIVELKIRQAIRQMLITEAETGTEEPSNNTGINVLANLLEKIIPVIEDDYKMLTTSSEQRESFRNHIIQAIKNSLRPLESANTAEKKALNSENISYNLDMGKLLADLLYEKVKIDLDPQADGEEEQSIEGEFINIDSEDEDNEFVQINDQNETGRNFAAVTFKAVEKQIVDAYDMLADEEDQNLFYDYLITNMLLYFDKFEDELQADLPATTTPEYEEEKETADSEENPVSTTDSEESSEDVDIFS